METVTLTAEFLSQVLERRFDYFNRQTYANARLSFVKRLMRKKDFVMYCLPNREELLRLFHLRCLGCDEPFKPNEIVLTWKFGKYIMYCHKECLELVKQNHKYAYAHIGQTGS